MFSKIVLVLCLLIGSGSSYGPSYRVPSVYTPASYLDQQQQQQQQQFQPQYTASFSPSQQQEQPFQYQNQASGFLQPQQAPWPSPRPNYFWPQQQQQRPFTSGQSPSLMNYFQPLLPSYPPNSLIVIYYQKSAKDAAAQQSLAQTPVDQQTTAVRDESAQSPNSNSNRYPHICKGEGIVRHPDDCLKFIRCRLSLRHHVYFYEERTCPRGLAFDPELETCNYQGKVVTCSPFHSASDPGADKTNQEQTTQSLLSYHGELPEPEKVDEETSSSFSSSNPSLYMLELPQPLSDSSEDANSQLEGNAAAVDESGHSHQTGSSADSSLQSVPLSGKNADDDEVSGLKSPPPNTKTVKKPSQSGTKKSTKKVSKRPSSGTNSAGGSTKSKSGVKEITPARKTQHVETFSIGDSAESARMMVDEDGIEEDQHQSKAKAVQHRQKVNSNVAEPKGAAPVSTLDHQPERSSVHYEDNDASEEESLASSV